MKYILLLFSIYSAQCFGFSWDSTQESIKYNIELPKILTKYGLNKSFYCDCSSSDGYLYLKRCSYNIQNLSIKASISHIIPIKHLFQRFTSTKCQGTNLTEECIYSSNKSFFLLINDPHNLFIIEPSISKEVLNKEISSEPINNSHYINACPIKINSTHIYFEQSLKTGWLARLYLYLNENYPEISLLSSKNVTKYQRLSTLYPPSKKECDFTLAINKKYDRINNITTKLCMNHKK